MAKWIPQKTPRELVLEEEPTAYEDDDGDFVYIRTKKVRHEICPTCKRSWDHHVVDYQNTLGSGGSSKYAWQSAAKKLGLLS